LRAIAVAEAIQGKFRPVPPQLTETSVNLARRRRVKRQTTRSPGFFGAAAIHAPSMEEKMLKSFAKTTFFAVALGFPLCEPASADFMEALKVSPRNSTFGPGAPVFEVESDGESWTRIKPDRHRLEVSIDIAAGSGWRVTNAYIGVPNADNGGNSNQSDATVRLGGGEDVKNLNLVKIYDFQTDARGLHQQEIIAACNAGDHEPTQEHPRPPRSKWGSKPIS
jgi:hypothetical protein